MARRYAPVPRGATSVPEGHSVHRLARGLQRAFAGHSVAVSSPQGRFASDAALLDGLELARAEAWGKHLFLHFDGGRIVHVHLGLYGTFIKARPPAPEPRGALRLRLESPTWYADLRGPTACDLMSADGRAAILARLGPDPLRRDADPAVVVRRITASRAPMATLLMDQSVIAGIGNIYRAELLWRHRIAPFGIGRDVDPDIVGAMWDDLVVLMKDGVRRGRIVTVTPDDARRLTELDSDRADVDVSDLDGGEDTPDRRRRRRETGVYVYRRAGRPCLRCGSTVAMQDLNGRRLYWCPGCQI
jgi:endonuclease VIII